MDTMPKSISDAIAALAAERPALAARLDAIDLALDNLRRLWPAPAVKRSPLKVVRKQATARVMADDSDAAQRRALLLSVISKSTVGLTLGELRAKTPKMDGKDRSNALQTMKVNGEIQRSGNAWVAAGSSDARSA